MTDRRPAIGRNITAAMALIATRTLDQLDRGFIPWEWDADTRRKVARACRYMVALDRWHREHLTKDKGKEAKGEDIT